MRIKLAGILASALCGAVSAYPALAIAPTAAALELVRGLQATDVGVDREGNLWTWDAQSRQVSLYSPQGKQLSSVQIGFATKVDADRTWGIAGVFERGTELRLLSWDGQARVSIPLADQAQGVAWIGPETVAVSPSLAAHRVELWNVKERRLTGKMGIEQALTPKPGVTRLRTVALDYQPERGLLYTLESFSGDLQVYSLDGRLVRQAKLPPIKRPIEAALAQHDKEAQARNDVQTPAIWWYWLAVDEAGTGWIVQNCDREHGKAKVLKVPLVGEAESLMLDQPCCSRALALWGGWAVFYSDPALPKAACDKARRLP